MSLRKQRTVDQSFPETSEKVVKDLNNLNFLVPSYQRGYRWDKQEVSELLDDIYEFFENPTYESGDKYCLQPIVVKQAGKPGLFEVIDGQQRLTTIYIILKYAYRNEKDDGPAFNISYKTRPDSKSFLEHELGNISTQECQCPDFFFMQQAWETIVEWQKTKDLTSKQFDRKIVSPLEGDVLLIWYELDQSQDAISVFRKLNIGRIPLTDAELIKGKMLGELNKRGNKDASARIAGEWDRIEQALQDDRFWYFLTNESSMDLMNSTRIDILFDIWKKHKVKTSGVSLSEKHSSFNLISKMIENDRNVEGLWAEIRDIYSCLRHWYTDDTMYHKVGYLIASHAKNAEDLFTALIGKKKSQINSKLDTLICSSLRSYNANTPEKIKNLDYSGGTKERKAIKRVLLLFNVKSILDSDKSSIRFPFELYKNNHWDLEHIHATASAPPRDAEINGQYELRAEYFRSLIKVAEDFGIELGDAKRQVENFIRNNHHIDEKLSIDFAESDSIRALYAAISENQDSISNLALLDYSTNRSYKAEEFLSKRAVIIEKDRHAEFIPICTKNAFLKYFNPNPQNFDFWTKNDREYYIDGPNGLLATISEYLDGDDNE